MNAKLYANMNEALIVAAEALRFALEQNAKLRASHEQLQRMNISLHKIDAMANDWDRLMQLQKAAQALCKSVDSWSVVQPAVLVERALLDRLKAVAYPAAEMKVRKARRKKK